MPVTKANALTALKVRATNVPGDYSDGNGLTLRVEKTGTKRWVQRVSIGGKQRNIGLGGHPAISLAAARDAAISNLQAIKTGRDVIAERNEVREAARQPKLTVPTFAEEAAAVIAMRRPTWSNQKHADQWESTLATYAFPVLGQKPVDSVTTADVLTVLTPIWTDKHGDCQPCQATHGNRFRLGRSQRPSARQPRGQAHTQRPAPCPQDQAAPPGTALCRGSGGAGKGEVLHGRLGNPLGL